MSREKLKCAASFCLVLAMALQVFFAFGLDVSADDEVGPPEFYIYDGIDFSSMTQIENYKGDNLYILNGAIKLDKEGASLGVECLDHFGGTFYGVYENPLDLSRYSEMAFSFNASSESGAVYSLSVSLSGAGYQYTASGTFTPGKNYEVFLPIASFEGRGALDHVYFTVIGDVTKLDISPVYADTKYTYSHIDLFGADDFSSNCPLELSERAITPKLSDGAGWIEAERTGSEQTSGSFVARVRVSGADAGTMTLSVGREDGEVFDVSSFNLFSGTNTYSFVYDAEKGDARFRITFSGVKSEGEGPAISGVSFTHYKESLSSGEGDMPCSITSCTVSSDSSSVNIRGTLSSSAVVNHINGKLGIYAVDMWNSAEPALLATADMSTLFDFKVKASSLPAPAGFCSFFAALVGDNGEVAETFSAPVYPTVSTASPAAVHSIVGVESPDTSAPFTANASSVLVEVNIDDLINSDPSGGRFHSYGGANYYFDAEYIAALDSSLGFFSSAGKTVYCRVVLSTKDGVYGALDTKDKESTLKYSAALDYLTRRYPSIYGIVVGCRINSFIYNSSKYSPDLFAYASNYVDWLRITASVARANIPSALVVVPLGDGYVYADDTSYGNGDYDEMTGVGKYATDPMLLASLISRFMPKGAPFPWHLGYECESAPAVGAETVSRDAARLIQNIGASPSGNMLIWHPEHAIDQSELTSLAEYVSTNLTSLGTKCLIISLNNQSANVAPLISSLEFEQSEARRIKSSLAVQVKSASTEGHVLLSDFRSSWGIGDFIAGGSLTSVTTASSSVMSDYDGISSGRALRAVSSVGRGAFGVLVTSLSPALPLSSADYIEFALCVTGEEGKSYPVKIVLTSGAVADEYDYTFTSGKPCAVRCKTDGSITEADSISLIIPGDEDLTLDLSRISLLREDGDTETIKNDLGKTEKKRDDKSGELTAILIAVTLISVVIFAAVSLKTDRGDRKKNK